MGDRLLFGHNAFQLTQAPLVGLVEIDGGAEIQPREQPVGVAAERVLAAGVRGDLVAQHRGERCCTRRRPPRRVAAVPACSASLSRRGIGHHVDEQLLDLARLLDSTRDLPDRGRLPGCHRRAQCCRRSRATRSGTRDIRRLISAQSSSVSVAIRSNTSRIDCSGEAITLSSPTSSPASCSSICTTEPFPHRGDGHDVDVVVRC